MAKEDTTSPEAEQAAQLPPNKIRLVPTGEQFRLLVEQVKDYAIFLLDPQGRVCSWNLGAERIHGYRAEEIIGRHCSVFFSEDDVEHGVPQRELERAISAGNIDREGWRLSKDGNHFWALVTVNTLLDEAGAVTGFGVVVRDVTQRRNMEEALQKSRNMFQGLFENAPDAVVVVDERGVIRKVNQQAEVIFGYLRDEMVGHRVELLLPERYRQRHRQQRRGYFADPRPRQMGTGLELYGRHRDGRDFPVDIMLNPIETIEGTWAFAVIRDVTQQKQHAAMITQLNTQLKFQVEQQVATNRELEAFSYSVSHDLRAPLRHIIGFVDLLNAKDHSALDEKSHHYLEVITQAAQKMADLIDDLLSFSRMGRTEMMKTQVDFDQLVRGVVREVAEDAGKREIEWDIAPLPALIGDASMLRQVMLNLIANAVKFTRPSPRARIEVGAREEDGEIRIYVRDNGVGFDEKYVNKLFGLFQRLHRAEEFEGTGVGLANVQRIVVRHGGRAWAEAGVNGGATFWFSLPKAAPDAEPAP